MRPTTMLWPTTLPLAQPRPTYGLRRMVGAGLAVAVVGATIMVAYTNGNDREATAREAARTARALGSFPISNRTSLEACGRRGVAIAACIESEEALRAKAETLWTGAPLDSRKACLDAANNADEPVGKLYVCLALLR